MFSLSRCHGDDGEDEDDDGDGQDDDMAYNDDNCTVLKAKQT